MAAITITPTLEVQVGDPIVITGTGFLPDTAVTVEIPEEGIHSIIKSDPEGIVTSNAVAIKAVGTLVSDGTVPTADDTVTIGAKTYKFVASPTTTANEVKIGTGGTAVADTLANLKAAVNLGAGSGTLYGSATTLNATVGAGALTATTLQLYAKTGGTAGNSLALTESGTHTSIQGAATTLLGGLASSGLDHLDYSPQESEPFTITMDDGTNEAELRVLVST